MLSLKCHSKKKKVHTHTHIYGHQLSKYIEGTEIPKLNFETLNRRMQILTCDILVAIYFILVMCVCVSQGKKWKLPRVIDKLLIEVNKTFQMEKFFT